MRLSLSIIKVYAIRGALIWLGVRLMVSVVFLIGLLNPLNIGTGGVIGIVLLSVGASVLDTYGHHERAWLANLGVQPLVLCCIFAMPALVGEFAIGAMRAGLR